MIAERTRLAGIGFGAVPKRSFLDARRIRLSRDAGKVRDREDALANTRDARSPQTTAATSRDVCNSGR